MKLTTPLTTALLVCAGPAVAETINFFNIGTSTTSALVRNGVTVTGSANINVLSLNGLGIVGGSSDNIVDSGETIRFTFTAPALSVTYALSTAGQFGSIGVLNDPLLLGERTVEAFSPLGVSLGTIAQSDADRSVSSLFGGVPIGSFSMTALQNEFFRIDSLTFVLGPSLSEESARFAASSAVLGRRVAMGANDVSRMRGRDSLTTRDANVSLARAGKPDTGDAAVSRSSMSHGAMAEEVYTWLDFTGFRSEDDGTARSYTGRGIQIGADIAVSPDMVVGLSLGVQELDASDGAFSQDGNLRFLQPYLAYRAGAWSGAATLTYGQGDYTQTSTSGTGEGETRLTALAFTGAYDIALDQSMTLTPTLELAHGNERTEGVSGTLTGATAETVRFTKVSVGARMGSSLMGGEAFAGLHADWLGTSSNTVLVSDALVDDGWTGRVEVGLSTELRPALDLDVSLEVSGLGGDLQEISGGLRFAFRF